MNSIHRLRDALFKALSPKESHHDEKELFDELMVQKPRLLKIFDVGPRNPQEQREFESGKPTINSKATAVNAEFARQVIFLSQQLDCSEKYIAGILHHVISQNPNIGSIDSMELTVAHFHQHRRQLVDSLRFLLEATEAAEIPDAPPIYKRIAKYMRSEILPGGEAGPAGRATLGIKVFKEIEQLDAAISKADTARKNAGTNTVIPTDQGIPTLGYDILNVRYDSLKYERRYLAITLSSIARIGFISPDEIKQIIDWLSNNSNHPMTYYFLTVVLLVLEPADPSNPLPSVQRFLANDASFMKYMTSKFDASTQWKNPSLKATILLKWTLFLTEARHNDATLENKAGFKAEELETQVWNAVQGDAFNYLALSVIHLQGKGATDTTVSILDNVPLDPQDQREIPPPDFKLVVLLSFESLVRSLITHASSELRKIKQRQEDLVLANARTDRTRGAFRYSTTLSPEADKPGPPPRHDIAMLYSFIGLLYASLPKEKALQFWGSGPQQGSSRSTYQENVEASLGRLPSFLQWAVWSTPAQDLTMFSALYDMLSGLANGQQCSELAYNFLARGGGDVLPGGGLSVSSATTPTVSWTAIFDLLESWATSASNPRPQPQVQPLAASQSFGNFQNLVQPPQPTPHQFNLTPKDVLFARSFLRLLATVVTHSIAVRTTISGHAHFRAIPTLLSLIPLGIPLELKGAIFETLSAFCEPGAGSAGLDICEAVWTLMERLEVINVRVGPSGGFGMALATGKGVEVELEQVETAHRIYPATIPFLKLLCTLLHTPKQISLQSRVSGVESSKTIPDGLGLPYRLPGIGPFTSFVVDTVFANIPNRDYSNPSDRWRINGLCLDFVEKSLASFSLESLIASGSDELPIQHQNVVSLLVHPGYDIMKRLLTSSPLHSSILSYIVDGLEGFEKGLADEEPFYRNTIIRVLRIVHRVLEIQDLFLDAFIPLLSDMDTSEIVGQTYSRSFFTRFDQALSFGPRYIPALAAYMTYPNHAELVLLSVKIVAKLSLSSSPSTLVTLIERSPDSDRILAGFLQILKSSALDDVEEAEAFADQNTGAGAPTIDSSSEFLEQATRLAALDLLIQDTESNRPFPNVAHFLLFGGQTIEDPHALGARQTSIHALLELVSAGVPRLRGKQDNRLHSIALSEPLFSTLPGLAERCYRVIYQLSVHPRTSDFTTRYLRTREDFFARQVARIPSFAPESSQQPPIQVVYTDGSRVTTTVSTLAAFLRVRSYIFDLVALELHILTNKGHHKAVSELLEIFFGTDFEYEEEHNFAAFHELGQSPMRVIDFLQSLLFDWADTLSVKPVDMKYLVNINLQSCFRRDAAGCEIVDRTALLSLLQSSMGSLHAQGTIATSAQNEHLLNEMNYILESCAVENHRRKVSFARAGNFEAWRRLLDIALTKSFDRLPHNRRENMLFDLLHVLPSAIRSSNIEENTAVLLSETILSSITKLREDRQHQLILQSLGSDSESGTLPAERLFNILRNILQGILDNNHVELVRGNLYAALINFLHLVRSSQPSPITQTLSEIDSSPFSASLALSTMRESVSRGRSPSLPLSSYGERSLSSTSNTLETGCLAVLKPVIERLVTTISRDAIDGTEVWKTVAFMLLDATVQLSSLEKQHIVLTSLNRHGILANFVRSIKESDSRLQGILKPDPEDLNTLYVYESKMSLFIRMSQTRAGAERLLEAQLLPILAQCDYLDTRPEADQSFIDQDSFLPSAIQRYHQLFMPALQVVDGTLATLGSTHATAAHQALEFLSNHGSTIAILLKSEAEYVSLPTLDEVHLIVTLCTSILPTVPKTEVLSPNSGYGAIHLAILGLSARCLGRGKTYPHVAPVSESDIALAQSYAFGFGNRSKFELKVQRKERSLRKSVVSYIGASSEFTEPEITLVLSPVTITPRNEERASHFAATVPTVGDTLVALDDLCHDLSETLKQISDIGAELANKDQIGLNSAQEILREIDPALLRELETEQKRTLLCEELDRIRRDARQDAKIILDTLEMLLLIIWRHVDYYAEPRNMNVPPTKATVGNAMRLLATAEPQAFRADVGSKILPMLQRLATLELDEESFGRDWQDNQGYLKIMCRRLRDSSGLHDESSTGGDSD